MTTKNLELKHLATKNEMEENITEDHQTKTKYETQGKRNNSNIRKQK